MVPSPTRHRRQADKAVALPVNGGGVQAVRAAPRPVADPHPPWRYPLKDKRRLTYALCACLTVNVVNLATSFPSFGTALAGAGLCALARQAFDVLPQIVGVAVELVYEPRARSILRESLAQTRAQSLHPDAPTTRPASE